MQSDVNWYFRLQTDNNVRSREIPLYLQELGAFPNNFISSYKKYYQTTGRFNIVDFYLFRVMAHAAGNNPDIWRLEFIIFLSFSVGLFYLICIRMGLSVFLSTLLSVGLMVAPLDIWTNYQTSEPKGIFFAMASFFVLLTFKNIRGSIASAILMLLAVLSKETFLVCWVVIPALILYDDSKISFYNYRSHFISNIKYLLPHMAALILFLIFVVFLKLSYSLNNPGYSFQNSYLLPNLIDYLKNFIPQILPTFFSGLWIPLLIFVFFLYFMGKRFIQEISITGLLLNFKFLFLFFSLLLSTVFSIAFYYLTNRSLIGHYIVPSNFLTALLFAQVLSPFMPFIQKILLKKPSTSLVLLSFILIYPARGLFFTLLNIFLIFIVLLIFMVAQKLSKTINFDNIKGILYSGLLFLLLIPHFDLIIKNSIKDSVDQQAWTSLIIKIQNQTPANAHVILLFAEPNMIETAQSLEANTLLAGRYDLIYHLIIGDKSLYKLNSGYVQYLVKIFNSDRRIIKPSNRVITIRADRQRQKSAQKLKTSDIDYFFLLFTNPNLFLFQRYFKDKYPYLNYELLTS